MSLILNDESQLVAGLGQGPGWGLAQFQAMFPNNRACAEYLETLRWPSGFICPWNGEKPSKEPWRRNRGISLICPDCHHQTSVTAKTLLDGLNLPLKTVFLSAWLLGVDDKLGAAKLQRGLGLAHYRAASMLLLRWRYAMATDLGENHPDPDWGTDPFTPAEVERMFRCQYRTEYKLRPLPVQIKRCVRSSKLIFRRLLKEALRLNGPVTEKQLKGFFRSGTADDSASVPEEHK